MSGSKQSIPHQKNKDNKLITENGYTVFVGKQTVAGQDLPTAGCEHVSGGITYNAGIQDTSAFPNGGIQSYLSATNLNDFSGGSVTVRHDRVSFQISNSGGSLASRVTIQNWSIIMEGIPTSPVGLLQDAVWKDPVTGVLSVVI